MKENGDVQVCSDEVRGDIESDLQKILDELSKKIYNGTVTINKLEWIPAWIINKALEPENNNNWSDANYEINERKIPRNANVIESHVI